VIPETASKLQPGAPWQGAIGNGWVGDRKKKQTKKIHQSFVFLLRTVFFFDN
jgi:hypothetical protein